MSILRAGLWTLSVLALVAVAPAAAWDAQESEPVATAAEPEGGEAGQDEPEEEPEEEPEPPDRITFDVPFSEDRGGGVARGSAGALEYVTQDFVIATGGVELAYQAYKFQAERVELDLKTKKLVALGHVVMDEGPRRMSGQRLEFDLESKTGTLFEGEAFVDPDLYFSGSEIEKISEDVYLVKDGMITSCSEDQIPDWSFKLGKGRIKVNGFARITNARLRMKRLPILFSPYMAFPTNQSRKSGLLLPNIGFNSTRGSILGLAYYQTLGPSYDATLYTDLYGKDFFGVGTEIRYAPAAGTEGFFNGYAIQDTNTNEWRWKARLLHTSEGLPAGLRAVVKVNEFSDFEFFRDFERSFNQISLRKIQSTGFLTGNWGSQSFNLMLQNLETFIRNGVVVEQQQLPEIEYKLRSTQLGKLPVYLSLNSSAHYFSIKRSDTLEETYGRADIAPLFTVPLSFAPWMSISATIGGRATFYQDSLTETGDSFSGESLTRVFSTAKALIVGPSMSKIYDKKIGRFGKFKHIVEPRFSYLFIDDFDDQDLVPLFDEIDTLRKRKIGAVSLVNRVLAKPADEESPEGTREILSFELTQAFSLNDDQPFERADDGTETRTGPILGRLRFTNGRRMNLESRFEYSTFLSGLRSASLSGGIDTRRHSAALTWFSRFDPDDTVNPTRTTSHQARLSARIQIVPSHLNLSSHINYDLLAGLLQQQRHLVTYTSQCWTAIFEYTDLRSVSRRQREYRFSIALKNIGSFIDLNSGSRDIY